MSQVSIKDVVAYSEKPMPLGPFVTPPERLVSGDPEQGIANYVTDMEGRLLSGVWQSTAGKWKAVSERREFCYIIQGEVTIRDAEGKGKHFVAGDAFMLPYGFDGFWEVPEFCEKYYVILQD